MVSRPPYGAAAGLAGWAVLGVTRTLLLTVSVDSSSKTAAAVRRAALRSSSVTVVDPVRRGLVRIVAALGTLTGAVPWSAYQTLPEVARERRSELTAFTAAIEEGLQTIQEVPIARLAELAQPSFPAIDVATLQAALDAYREMEVWSTTPEVPRVDFDRFAGLLVAAGWLHQAPAYDELVLSLA
jgi:NitT/TauT family transport system substrate-binding protein